MAKSESELKALKERVDKLDAELKVLSEAEQQSRKGQIQDLEAELKSLNEDELDQIAVGVEVLFSVMGI
ncbi:MAG: hypothetical protein KBT02_09275 [Treponema sp.]|nr:hypothetical protein [Candidatus Treponema caballi]